MPPVGRSNRGHIMNKIKMYNTNLTTMDADLFKQIKTLAAKLNKDQNELLEEAAQDLIKNTKTRHLRWTLSPIQKPTLMIPQRPKYSDRNHLFLIFNEIMV